MDSQRELPSDGKRPADQIALPDIGLAVLRYRWTFLAIVFLFIIGAILPSYLGPELWTARASFRSQSDSQGPGRRLSTLAGQFGIDVGTGVGGESPAFYARLVHSREILGFVAMDTFRVHETGTLAEILEIEAQTQESSRAAAIGWLREVLTVESDVETGIVQLGATTSSPVLSAQIVASALEAVQTFNLRTRQSRATAERRFAEERLENAQRELRTAEARLQEFLERNRAFENSPELLFEHDRLERRVAMRQQVVTSLAEMYEQARINEVRNTPVLTIIEEPEVPVSPQGRNRLFRLIAGLLGGLLLAVFIVLLREYFRRYRNEHPEHLSEVAALWRDSKKDMGRFAGWVRRRRRHKE